MTFEDTLKTKLTHALNPSLLKIHNESHLHQGHGGSPNTGESHFAVIIVSEVFEGMGRIDRHQKVYQILEKELSQKEGSAAIHALKIRAFTQVEWDALKIHPKRAM